MAASAVERGLRQDEQYDAIIPADISRDQERLLDIVDGIVPNGVEDGGKVISIYGGGGQGKTTFLSKIEQKVRDRLHGAIVIRVNLESDRLQSPEDILFEIASSINERGVSVPDFLGAYYTRLYATDPNSARSRYLRDFGSFNDKGSQALWSFVGSLAFIGTTAARIAALSAPEDSGWNEVSSALGIAADLGRMAAEKLTEAVAEAAWRRVVVAFEDGTEQHDLSVALAKDIGRWTNYGNGRAVVVIVDTLERLFWEIANCAGRYDARGASWFEPLTRARGSLWVVAGRTEVGWDNIIQLPIQFDSLGELDSRNYLAEMGVTSERDVASILKVSGRIPLYLKLCASYVSDHGVGSSCELDGMERKKLVSHYYRFLPEGVREALTVASFLVEWTDDTLVLLARGTRAVTVDAKALHALSFVEEDPVADGAYRLHEVVAEALRSGCGDHALLETIAANCWEWIGVISSDERVAVDERRRRRIPAWSVLERLADVDPALVGGEEERFRILMKHADDVRGIHAPGKALGLYRAIEGRYSESDSADFRKRRLEAMLKQAAVGTDLFLSTGVASFQEGAIAKEREVVAEVVGLGLGDALLANALNSLGLSLSRFYLYKPAEALADRALSLSRREPPVVGVADVARFANNLGTVLQGHADHCAGLENAMSANSVAQMEAHSLGIKGADNPLAVDMALAKELYHRAKDSYGLSYELRAAICGGGEGRDGRTAMLVSLTNLANATGRLGVLEGDKALVKEAKKRLKKALKLYAAYYELTNRDYLRCRYARAYLQERSALLLSTSDEDYERRIAKALRWHEDVLELRIHALGGSAQVTKRSRERVDECRRILASLGGSE